MENPDCGWCCGPKDCAWLAPADVRVDGEDYVVDWFAIRWPNASTFRSLDDRFWVCRFMAGTADEVVKCYFAPARSM